MITKYAELANNPKMAEVWSTAFGKEFGGLAQGDEKMGAKGTNKQPHHHDACTNKKHTYGSDYYIWENCGRLPRAKEDPNRVRITAGGNLINYPGELTIRTADLTTSKILWNSVLSTERAWYMCLNINLCYLCAALDN